MKTTIIEFKTAIIALLFTILAGVGAKAQTPAWTVNPGDYRYDMSLYMTAAFQSQPMDYSEYIVAAFVGDECRGIAEKMDLPDGKQCLYMRIRSNVESGETLTFKYRNIASGKVSDIEGVSLAFESNKLTGYPSDPWKVVIERYYDVSVTAGNGGTVNDAGGRKPEGAKVTLTATPSEGHFFEKWSDGNTDNPRELTVNDDIALTAEFGVNSYKLTYTVDGETYNESEVEYGTALTAIAAPTKEGYTFSGWEGLPATMPAKDVAVSGTFSINTYKATFKIGEETVATLDVVFGQPVVAPEAPAKEGHTFAGWQDVPATMPAKDVTVLGSYTVNKYKLTYTVDGAKYQESEVEYGTALTAIEAPVKEGYTFSGWEGLPATMPAKDVTVSGTFSINTYKATFKIGEETIATLDVVFGQLLTAPEAPAKEGHTFAGWDTFPANMPAEDLTVTGTYTVNKYKLTYTVDGAKYDESEVDYGTPPTAIAAPVKEGYTFSGWSELPATMPAKDVTISGTFSINTYKATFKVGEETVATLDVVFGQPVTAPEAPAKEGKTFAGWQDVPETMPAHDVTVLGSYTVNKYKLSYVIDGEAYKTIEVEYGAAIVPEAPEKEGYTFSGWEGLPTTMPAQDVTVSGDFSINTYKATFKIGEETIATLDVVFGQPVTAPKAPDKEGHTFAGWQDVPATMPARDVTVLGSYTVNKYKLNYVIDGKAYKTIEVEYGAAIVPETPEKEGYTFSGWEGLPETMPAEDVTATGKFNVNTYKASFKIGEEVIATLDVVFGEAVVAPEAPAKEGHTFAGWQDVPATMPTHDVTVLGSYTVNKYNLSYIIDGENYKTVEVEYGAAIVPETPEKEGYTFSGWEGLPETMPDDDVTATGRFTVNTYKATFKIGEETIATLDVVFGQPVTAPEAPAKEGHTFAGWQDVPETMPAHDVTILGSYTVNKYKLNYVIDGEEYKTIEVEYGAAIVPEAPEREGHTFSGWEGLPETMPAEDVTATGSFTVNNYKLTVYLNDEIYLEQSLEYGAGIVIPDPELPEHLVFKGWEEEIPETMPAHDVTIHGRYDDTSGVSQIRIDDDCNVTVVTPEGQLLYRDRSWSEVKQKLRHGIYIINGAKHLIR